VLDDPAWVDVLTMTLVALVTIDDAGAGVEAELRATVELVL
jgi:hypothetical protein